MKQKITKTLIVVASVIIALIISEAGLRLLGIDYPDFFDNDPVLGSKLRPGIKGYYLNEGGGYVSINADGLRDREHSLQHPPNTLRIAVLGDSYAEAMHVNQEEAFWAVLEKDLQGCSRLRGRQVEVINFGQAGFGTAQELLALRHRVWKYSPDVVLLAFLTGNDLADNSPTKMGFEFNPYFSFQNGELVLNDRLTREKYEEVQKKTSWVGKFKRWRQDHFSIFQVMQQSQRAFKAWWSQPRRTGETATANHGSEAGLDDTIYKEPSSPIWQEAWKVTEAVLLLMRDEVAAKGARFFVVVLTNGVQVQPDPENRKNFAKWIGVQDLLYPDRRLERFCQRQGIPILLLVPAFQEYATEHKVFLHGFKGNLGNGHWNQNGHRLAGNMIARWLCGQFP